MEDQPQRMYVLHENFNVHDTCVMSLEELLTHIREDLHNAEAYSDWGYNITVRMMTQAELDALPEI